MHFFFLPVVAALSFGMDRFVMTMFNSINQSGLSKDLTR